MLPILPFATTVVLVLSPGVTTLAQGNSCGACNCQFSNVDLLIDLIREEINSTISEQLYGMSTFYYYCVITISVTPDRAQNKRF